MLKTRYSQLKVVFINEISMVGGGELNFINCHMQEITGELAIPNCQLFGGVHRVMVGDFFQLEPVCNNWIFKGKNAVDASLWQNTSICMS